MTQYDQQFYDTIREGAKASAAAVVPVVMDVLGNPRNVIDLGCGEGWWAQAFVDAGCEKVVGIDGDYSPQSPLGRRFMQHDLAQPFTTHDSMGFGQFNLAVSLEVAEHLPPARADSFVLDLVRLAPVVLFSAAIPGQGGTGHVNEQWPGYWVERFAAHRYACSGALRWRFWDDPRVENWYSQNMLIAAAEPQRYPSLFDTPLAPMWPVVHPVLYDARRQQ